MPESRQRHKRTAKRYQLEPQRRARPKTSPRWFGPVVLGVMAIGVIVIVWNYVTPSPSNVTLLVGLGLIAAGFVGTSFWR